MSLKIRLTRTGAKGDPHYRIVVADSRSPRDGRIVEQIGTYHPRLEKDKITIKEDKLKQWIGKGAKCSVTVASLLKEKGIEGIS